MQWTAFLVAGKTQSKVEEEFTKISAPLTGPFHCKNETSITWPRPTRDLSRSVLKTFRGKEIHHLSGQPVQSLSVIMVKKNYLISSQNLSCFNECLFSQKRIKTTHFTPKNQKTKGILMFQHHFYVSMNQLSCFHVIKLLQDNLYVFGGQCEKTWIYPIVSSLNHRKKGKKI